MHFKDKTIWITGASSGIGRALAIAFSRYPVRLILSSRNEEKLEETRTGRIHFTRVACQLLDIERCRCTDYTRRAALVPDCLRLQSDMGENFRWLPVTCAYRLLHEGRPLPDWHPLVSGDPDTVHRAGISVRGVAIAKQDLPDRPLEDFIVLTQDL